MKKIVGVTLLAALTFAIVIAPTISALEPVVQATVSVYPTQLQAGSDGYIQLTLRNTGTAAASRVKISSVTTDAPIRSENWATELGALNAGDSLTSVLKFTVLDNAYPGLYSILFAIDYCEDSSCKTIYPSAILNVQAPSALEVVSVQPSTLKLGEKVNISFTIANKGEQVKSAIFTWSSSNNIILPVGSSNRVVIPVISGNSVYRITSEVVVSPSATPGVYPVNIYIQYTDRSGLNQTVTSVTGIEISGETDFDVSMQEYTAGSLTLAVTNIGSTTAYSTVVRIPQQEDFRVTGSSSAVLGNLNAGDYTLTSFQIAPTRTVGGKLIVEISYTDLMGVRRTVQKDVLVSAVNATEWRARTIPGSRTTSNSISYILIGAVGIVCILAIIKLRKRIKKK
jgi:hypothetical protein